MTKKNAIFIVLGAVIGAAFMYLWVAQNVVAPPGDVNAPVPHTPPYAPVTAWKVWENQRYSKTAGKLVDDYTFSYPRDFDLRQGSDIGGVDEFSGTTEARVSFPRDAFQDKKTNYVEAFMDIASGNDQPSLDSCLKDPRTKATLTKTETINGATFYAAEDTGAGAGNFYHSLLYRTIHNGRCYDIVLTVHTGNISNYPSGTVTEFDENRAYSILKEILGTFTFKI
jgi:hypothetical protein